MLGPAAAPLPDRLESRCLNSTVPAQDRHAVQQSRRRNYAVEEIRNRFTRHFHHFHRNPFVERDAPQNGRFIQSRGVKLQIICERELAICE